MEKTGEGASRIGTDHSTTEVQASSRNSQHLQSRDELLPGIRPDDANNSPGSNPPSAGDVDSGDTDSATETGQDGDKSAKSKKKAYNYS